MSLSFAELYNKMLMEVGADPMLGGGAPADPMAGGAGAAPPPADPMGGLGGGGMPPDPGMGGGMGGGMGQGQPPQEMNYKSEKGAYAVLKDYAKKAEEKKIADGKKERTWGKPKEQPKDKEKQFKPNSLRM